MSSAFNAKNGGLSSSSDLTRLRRQTAELAAYAAAVSAANTKKISAQSGTTAGILALNTSAVTTAAAVTVGVAVNPFTRLPVTRRPFPITSRYIPANY
jgi:hypothetical protein